MLPKLLFMELLLSAKRLVKKVDTKVIHLTSDELIAIVEPITKSTVVNIIYVVDDSRSKTVKGVKQVQKMAQITHCYLNHDYTQKVKNLTGNTEFVANELKGKTRVSKTVLQSDKTGEKMIDGKVLDSGAAKILCYFHNGKRIKEIEAIAADLWIPQYYNPTPKTTMGRGEVSEAKDFAIINTYFSRIYRLKMFGQWYQVTDK